VGKRDRGKTWHAEDGIKLVVFSPGCQSVRPSVHHEADPLD